MKEIQKMFYKCEFCGGISWDKALIEHCESNHVVIQDMITEKKYESSFDFPRYITVRAKANNASAIYKLESVDWDE